MGSKFIGVMGRSLGLATAAAISCAGWSAGAGAQGYYQGYYANRAPAAAGYGHYHGNSAARPGNRHANGNGYHRGQAPSGYGYVGRPQGNPYHGNAYRQPGPYAGSPYRSHGSAGSAAFVGGLVGAVVPALMYGGPPVPPSYAAAPPRPAAPNWSQVETAMSNASRALGNNTHFTSRGFIGLVCSDKRYSCVGAATDRAQAIATALQNSGALGGNTATVGIRNGYQIGGASFHTYTVVQIKDPHGRVLRNYAVDNYVGPTSVQQDSVTPNFDQYTGDSDVIRSVGPSQTSTGTTH